MPSAELTQAHVLDMLLADTHWVTTLRLPAGQQHFNQTNNTQIAA
jgi:hypothetical protein